MFPTRWTSECSKPCRKQAGRQTNVSSCFLLVLQPFRCMESFALRVALPLQCSASDGNLQLLQRNCNWNPFQCQLCTGAGTTKKTRTGSEVLSPPYTLHMENSRIGAKPRFWGKTEIIPQNLYAWSMVLMFPRPDWPYLGFESKLRE